MVRAVALLLVSVVPAILAMPEYNIINITRGSDVPVVCATNYSYRCFPKCCSFGNTVVNKICAPSDLVFDPYYWIDSDNKFRLLEENPEDYMWLVGDPCDRSRVSLNNEDDLFYVDLNGTLYATDNYGVMEKLLANKYCLDATVVDVNGVEEVRTVPFICDSLLLEARTPLHICAYPIGLLISVSFLLITMLVYLMVPDLRDLHGKTLVCHVSCLILAYVFLVTVQLGGENFHEECCKALAFIIQFFFLGSFFWLNVLCFDASWCVTAATGTKVRYPGAKVWIWEYGRWMAGKRNCNELEDSLWREENCRFEQRVFWGYSVYAWVFSMIPLVSVLAQDLSPTIPYTYLDYSMVSYNCQFLPNIKSMPYFYSFIGFTMVINLFLFLWTVVNAFGYEWNSTGGHRIPKQKARMCFLLFTIVAMNWVTDIVAWAIDGQRFIYHVLDAFNLLQGLITFCIFVLEVRVKYLIKTKLWPKLCSIKDKYNCCKYGQHKHNETVNENSTMMPTVPTSPER